MRIESNVMHSRFPTTQKCTKSYHQKCVRNLFRLLLFIIFFFFKKYVYDKELRTRGTLTASRVFENNWRSRIHVMRRDPMATRIIRSFLMFSVYMNRIVLLLSLKVPAKFVVNSFSCFCIYKSKLLSIFKNKQRVLV